jgi:hypothetical protein
MTLLSNLFSPVVHMFFCAPVVIKTIEQRLSQHGLHGECAETIQYIATKQTIEPFALVSYIVEHRIIPSDNKSEPACWFGSIESTCKVDPHVMGE